jgi:cyclopropane fatty-acyl-phospholipid synthase-like methyltransferase
MFTNHDIARYYDLSEVHYRTFWDLDKARSLHYGYWTPDTKNFREALLMINKVMADSAGINEGDRVLDAGCGVGGSSLWLAANRNCRVTGISLNKNQVNKANSYAHETGIADRVQFEQKDYCATGYAAESFDVVWAIESVCYANDKSDFIREAFRLLKKGGRLIVTDFFKAENLQGKAAADVQKMANGWAVNEFATAEKFTEQLSAAGFQHIEINNASKAILPSAKRLYRAYFLGKPASVLYNLFKPNSTLLAKNNVETALLQYTTLKKGWWSYRIFKGEK